MPESALEREFLDTLREGGLLAPPFRQMLGTSFPRLSPDVSDYIRNRIADSGQFTLFHGGGLVRVEPQETSPECVLVSFSGNGVENDRVITLSKAV